MKSNKSNVNINTNSNKTRSKLPTSSNQSSRFIEKQLSITNNTTNIINTGFTLSLTNAPISLSAFLPNDNYNSNSESKDVIASHEIDFEIGKCLKRLDKKDPITKQKSLSELLMLIDEREESDVVASVRLWARVYERLSMDEDRGVRQLTQRVNASYARRCGSALGPVVRQLLPAWVLASHSDYFCPTAARIARDAFNDTFSTDDKRCRAYLLCWRSVQRSISTSLNRPPLDFTSDPGDEKSRLKRDVVEGEIVAAVRTIVAVMPHVSHAEFWDLIENDTIWTHYTSRNASVSIRTAFIELGSQLLRVFPDRVADSPRLIERVCVCLRLLIDDNCGGDCVVRAAANAALDLCRVLSRETISRVLDLHKVFIPRLKRVLEQGAIHALAPALPGILVALSLPPDSLESILRSMVVACDHRRVVNSECAANSALAMTLDLALHSVLTFPSSGDSIIDLTMSLVESRMSDRTHKLSTGLVPLFTSRFVFPLLLPQSASSCRSFSPSRLIDAIKSWIDKHDENRFFCEKLTCLLLELRQNEIFAAADFAEILERKSCHENRDACLVPFLSLGVAATSDIYAVLRRCSVLMRDRFDPSTGRIVSRGLASLILSSCPSVQISSRFRQLLDCLSASEIAFFYRYLYQEFLSKIQEQSPSNMASISSVSVTVWTEMIRQIVERIAADESSSNESPISVSQIIDLSVNLDHETNSLISVLDAAIASALSKPLSVDSIDRLAAVVSTLLNSIKIMPSRLIVNLLKLIISLSTANLSSDNTKSYIDSIMTFIRSQDETRVVSVSRDLIDEAISSIDSNSNLEYISSSIVARIIESSHSSESTSVVKELFGHIDQELARVVMAVEAVALEQQRYSSDGCQLSHRHHELVARAVRSIGVIRSLAGCREGLKLESSSSLAEASILIGPVAARAFASCQHSRGLLEQCQLTHQTMLESLSPPLLDELLQTTLGTPTTRHIFLSCPTLSLLSIRQLLPDNYSQWSSFIRDSIDSVISSWVDLDDHQFFLVSRALLPRATMARYLVQDVILASLSSYLSSPPTLTVNYVNRALSIMANLTAADPGYFQAFFPLFLIHLKPTFDQLIEDQQFDLTALLEFIYHGFQSSIPLDATQWEFVFCLLDTLIRTDFFTNSFDYRSECVIDGRDRLVNSVWLLKLISVATVSMASVVNDTIVDEWDNLFSESVFTAVLYQFSLVSGDYQKVGKIIHSDRFVFYLEALSESVSVCPINVLLNHEFPSVISINDPIDLPKRFLIVFNYFLESLSSYLLSVQLASYNCLLNLTDNLSELLLEQINASEKTESLELFSINLPHKLLSYLITDDNFDTLNIDKIENQIVLIRCFLSWNIVLQLFSSAQPKLRAEIGVFLTQNDRCFDRFLNFCFTFMPKNPIVNKRHLSFINDKNNSCNLIAEEPEIFAQCIEKRSKFIIYHLSAYIFRRSMQVLPNLCRGWWRSLEPNSQQLVDDYVRQFLTRELCKIEFKQLKEIVDKEFDDKLEIKAIPMIGEVTVKYNVSFDQSLEQVITLPNNYPIGNIRVEFKKEMTVKIPHWKNWIGQMTMTLQNQNGSIFDGVKLWKKNLDNHFNGIEECMICYSIIHATKYTLPTMPCYQCRKRFHKDCMYKWFHSSTNPTCPNCRNLFYDGTQKLNK